MNLLAAIVSSTDLGFPDISLGTVSFTSTTAALNGEVTTKDNFTTVQFEYSVNSNLFDSITAPASGVNPSPITSVGTFVVSAVITGLTPSTTYYFRLQARNAATAPDFVSTAISSFTTLAS